MLLFAGSVLVQGGPPFRSDDPGTAGNRHWEINIAGIGERNPVQGTYSLPNFDINYGLGDRIQLKYEQAAGLQETRGSSPQLLGGVGNSIAGFKYRFYEHLDPGGKESNFALAIYPQLVCSTVRASVRRGISDPAQLYLRSNIPCESGECLYRQKLGIGFLESKFRVHGCRRVAYCLAIRAACLITVGPV